MPGEENRFIEKYTCIQKTSQQVDSYIEPTLVITYQYKQGQVHISNYSETKTYSRS